METHVVLTVGTILLSGGFFGLLVVRLSNPFFRGLWWLGAAYAVGALGAGILSSRTSFGGIYLLMFTQSLFLLAFVLLHVCFLELMESRVLLPRLGLGLLVVQAVAYVGLVRLEYAWNFSLILVGALVAIQALQTAALLWREGHGDMTAPTRFSMGLLLLFAAYSVLRTVVVMRVGVALDYAQPNPLETVTAIVYLGTSLGLGFGVFWMTSAQIRVTLEKLANTDPLTKVANRRCFETWCERELQRSARTGEKFSLILMDLDYFKQINDRYGHATGDAALCLVASRLQHNLRTIDMLGRWGGEEFVALLPSADKEAAQQVAQRLRTCVELLSLSSLRISKSGLSDDLHLTVSVGVTTYRGETDTLASLFARCDRALYEAKTSGRNRIVSSSIDSRSFTESLRSLS